MKQFAERGMDKAGIKLIGPGDIADDELLLNMGDAMLGTITAHFYSAAYPSAMNKVFVAAFQKDQGVRPNLMVVSGYDGMHLIYEALRKSNGVTDGDTLVAAMRGTTWESPRDGDRYGFINRDGNLVFPERYDSLGPHHEHFGAGAFVNGLAPAVCKRYWGFIDKDGAW
jgi:ABC-type branched-subunit amino acid transport system substrate-binding protein